MNTMRKWIGLLLADALLLGLVGCAKAEEPESQSAPTEAVAQQSPQDVRQSILDDQLSQTAQWLLTQIPEPVNGSVGGEWMILGLARGEAQVPGGFYDNYFERLAEHTAEEGGVLHSRKYTEYSRVILALTAIGRDPRDVGGYDLIQPLADFDQTVFQGINGAIFALLALDSGGYDIPQAPADSTQATREGYLSYILDRECTDGGWALSGDEADVDITAMALQALAKYQEQQEVAAAVERGITRLSQMQQEDGGYTAYGSQSSESISQVLVALAELGLDVEDERFVKNGVTLKDKLLQYRLEDGSFRHTLEEEADLMATEQAFYALVALARVQAGASSLYSMQ